MLFNDNKKTDSLDTSGERVGSFKPLPIGLVAYTFADIRTQLFLGVLPENIAQGQFQVEAGAKHELQDGTTLRASVIPITPIEQETWKDPFVVGQNRKKTDISSFGIKLAVENIRRSGLGLKYGWAHQNIDDEIWQHPEVIFQGNCGACHLDAELGTFEDAAMRLPDNVKMP